MKGGQPRFKMLTTLKRAKVYFIIIALTMTVTLFFLSYGWRFSGKTYKIHTTRLTVSKRFSVNSTSLNSEASKRLASTRVSFNNNTSHIFTTFLDSRTSHSKSTESLKYKQVNKTVLGNDTVVIGGRNSSNKSMQLTNNKTKLKLTDGIRQQTILDLAKTVSTRRSTVTASTEHKMNNSKHIENPARTTSTRGDNVTEPAHAGQRKKPHSKQSSISATRSHSNDKEMLSNSVRQVSNDTANTVFTTITTPDESTRPSAKLEQTKQTYNTSIHATNSTKPKPISVTSESKAVHRENETSSQRLGSATDIGLEHKHERHTNESNGTLNDHEVNNSDRKSVSNFTMSPQHTHDPALLNSVFQTDDNKHYTFRTDRQRVRSRDSHRYETIGLRRRPKYSVLDQLKYGVWNPRDRNRAPAKTRGGGYPTVRPEGCKGCFKTDFNLIINAPNICKTGENVSAILFIASAPQNKQARDVIRRTWGKLCYEPRSTIRCVFVFGEHNDKNINTALASEGQLYQDMIQFAFHDVYANLTYKTMMSLKWASDNCKTANYIMKTDDDMYVNTELLPLFLQGAPNSKFFGGFCWGPSSPHRDTNSKWYVSYEQFAQPLYPTMCSGTGYLMTRDVLLNVLDQSRDVPFFYLEDVYVSLCLKKGGIQPLLLAGFSNMKVEYEACAFRNKVITSHGHTPYELDFIWTGIHGCAKEENLTPEMVFNPKYFR